VRAEGTLFDNHLANIHINKNNGNRNTLTLAVCINLVSAEVSASPPLPRE
jgi:hypothetical protein